MQIVGAQIPSGGGYTLNISTNVPEPATLSLLALGIGLLGARGVRKARRS